MKDQKSLEEFEIKEIFQALRELERNSPAVYEHFVMHELRNLPKPICTCSFHIGCDIHGGS